MRLFWIYSQGCQIRRWGSLMRLGLVLNIVRWCIWNRILSSSCQIWWVGGILERSKFELLDTLCNYLDIWGNKYFFVYPKAPIVLWILAPKSHYLVRKAEKPTLNGPNGVIWHNKKTSAFKCLGLFNTILFILPTNGQRCEFGGNRWSKILVLSQNVCNVLGSVQKS